MPPEFQRLIKEVVLTASRSDGPGGQAVNKVNTKVTLRFDVPGSNVLTEEQKEVILQKLGNKLTGSGVLVIAAQESRSQQQNREAVLAKFERLIRQSLIKKKARKATKPSKQAAKNRIEEKKRKSEKKKWRQRPGE